MNLIDASKHGHVDSVRQLLKDEATDVHVENDLALKWACKMDFLK